MKTFRVTLLALTCSAFLHAEMPTRLSWRQAAAKAKAAHSQSDYRDLAEFYKLQATVYSSASRQQQEQYEYAVRHWTAKSYPQPADRARSLSEYYSARSRESARLAALYSDKAEASGAAPLRSTTESAVALHSAK